MKAVISIKSLNNKNVLLDNKWLCFQITLHKQRVFLYYKGFYFNQNSFEIKDFIWMKAMKASILIKSFSSKDVLMQGVRWIELNWRVIWRMFTKNVVKYDRNNKSIRIPCSLRAEESLKGRSWGGAWAYTNCVSEHTSYPKVQLLHEADILVREKELCKVGSLILKV